MSGAPHIILTAIALVFVIEGLLYALFPGAVQKMMRMAIDIPPEQLRIFGLLFAGTGIFFVWMIRSYM